METGETLNESHKTVYSLEADEMKRIDLIKKLSFYAGAGNNEKVFRRVMAKRDWWKARNENKKATDKISKKVDLKVVKDLEFSDFIWVQSNK